ncbi:PulJ/GspJ family protein [Paraglaciecola aestuariivivens]
MFTPKRAAAQGFTLVELITVIIVLGVVSVGISGFIRTGVDIYSDNTQRDQLLGDSRFVMERLSRELRGAIPNSVRVAVNGSNSIHCLEFVPALWVSFYSTLPVTPDTSTSANIFAFADNPSGFDLAAGDFAVVYPTSTEQVYDPSFNKRIEITDCTDQGDTAGGTNSCSTNDDPNGLANLTLAGPFADHSPASRLFIARNTVSYCANSNGTVYRVENSNFTNTQVIHSSGDLMVQNLNNDLSLTNEAPFTVAEATLSRNSLVQILLAFKREEEIVNFSTEVHIPNVP